MHKYLRAVGFSDYRKKKDIAELLENLLKDEKSQMQVFIDDTLYCQYRIQTAEGMGLNVVGEQREDGTFEIEYYFPYLESDIIGSESDCVVQRHTERETFAGLLDEYRVGISLIFYVDNSLEYRMRKQERLSVKSKKIYLSGLSNEGKILLPIHKTTQQREMAKVASKDRSLLLEAAKNGDAEAIETLTVEDIDMYSRVSKRAAKEDLYSIIDSCFMPSGIECDQYSIIGEIRKVDLRENSITDEEIYDLTIECNDIMFHIGINKADLLGEPEIGRRFKGQIWMMGKIEFNS